MQNCQLTKRFVISRYPNTLYIDKTHKSTKENTTFPIFFFFSIDYFDEQVDEAPWISKG